VNGYLKALMRTSDLQLWQFGEDNKLGYQGALVPIFEQQLNQEIMSNKLLEVC